MSVNWNNYNVGDDDHICVFGGYDNHADTISKIISDMIIDVTYESGKRDYKSLEIHPFDENKYVVIYGEYDEDGEDIPKTKECFTDFIHAVDVYEHTEISPYTYEQKTFKGNNIKQLLSKIENGILDLKTNGQFNVKLSDEGILIPREGFNKSYILIKY